MKALIFGSYSINNYDILRDYLKDNPVIICCDGGLLHSEKLDLFPDYIIGDFDSVEFDVLKKYMDSSAKILKYPVEKDKTDLELAIDLCCSLKIEEIYLVGVIGGRLGHTLGNITLLERITKYGFKCRMLYDNGFVTLINKEVEIRGEKGCLLSLIPLTKKVEAVMTFGLKYPLYKEVLYRGELRGVSNLIIDDVCRVTIEKGLLLAMTEKSN